MQMNLLSSKKEKVDKLKHIPPNWFENQLKKTKSS
jgi:flagellar biogenesis protein FliO